jgi:hypothetical protein
MKKKKELVQMELVETGLGETKEKKFHRKTN